MPINHGANIWFANPWSIYCPAVHATFFTFVTPGGTLDVLRVDDNTLTETWLGSIGSTGYSCNDHYSGAGILLPNGKIAFFFITPTGSDLVYRILDPVTSVFGSTISMGMQAKLGNTYQLSYANPLYNSVTGRLSVFFQQVNTAVGNTWCVAHNLDGLASNSWTAETFWACPGAMGTYLEAVSNGVDRMDLLLTDNLPTDGLTSSYHVTLKSVSPTVTQWQDSFGTNLGATSNVSKITATKVIDGSTVGNLWIWDIGYDPGGAPVTLHVTYVGDSTTNMKYRAARFNGAAWTSAEVCDGPKRSLDELTNTIPTKGLNRQYAAGVIFDGNDTRRVYACGLDSTGSRVEEWVTSDYATWTLARTIFAPELGVNHKRCRPTSPKGYAPGGVSLAHWYGTYYDYADQPGHPGYDMVLTYTKAPTAAQTALITAANVVAADTTNTASVRALGAALANYVRGT